ncbi:flagellar protein FliT [Rummeliibacillus sp. TYF005]|uniref:flagellar protein FliT n=1 Tax=Rummeliibacillus sp. TYF005 TaxID=2058214 RepID=UPI000F52E49E|nr:flagellar protein FliT [Rummeliibacillus sp. TYF005]RPJ96834.1 flagellar protein FliT [Rummeliibacillus sp. TYF005]
MELVQEFLQVSAQLYKHLTKLPPDKERDEYIQKIDEYLDKRGSIIKQIQKLEVNPLPGHPFEKQLRELDKGIRERLKKAKAEIAQDMKNLQKTKKSEQRYVDPYSSVRVMDGTYFDGRK